MRTRADYLFFEHIATAWQFEIYKGGIMNKTTRCSSIRESDFTLDTFQLNQIPWGLDLTNSNLSYLEGYQIVSSVPEPNLCRYAKILGLAKERCKLLRWLVNSRNLKSSQSVGCDHQYIILNRNLAGGFLELWYKTSITTFSEIQKWWYVGGSAPRAHFNIKCA